MRGRESRCDDLGYSVKIVQNLVVPEAQHAIAFALEESSAPTVIGIVSVLSAVCFVLFFWAHSQLAGRLGSQDAREPDPSNGF